jgi:hypothetical protein
MEICTRNHDKRSDVKRGKEWDRAFELRDNA